MDWKFDDTCPIWLQLTEGLTLSIVAGTYPPGSRLPSVRELAAEAGVNPNTMQRALAQLEADGLALGGRTAGRTVTTDTAAIEAVRRRLARENGDAYLAAMARLGYGRQAAIQLLKEENDNDRSDHLPGPQ